MAVTRPPVLTGDADGTFTFDEFKYIPLTCYLESVTFFDGDGAPISPSVGVTLFEYQTYNDDDWREWDTAARNDYADGVNYPSRVTGKIIRRVRVSFFDFPAGTTFECRILLSEFPDATPDARVQGGDQAYTVQPFTEANSKDGLQYYKNINFDNLPTGAAGVRWTRFVTGNKDVLVKVIELNGNNELFDFAIFRDTVGTAGTPVTVQNYNDRPTAPATTVVITDNITVAGGSEGSPVTDNFRAVGSPSVGGRAIGSKRGSGIEFVLRKNTTYAIRQRNLSTTNTLTANLYFTWYEGPISVDI